MSHGTSPSKITSHDTYVPYVIYEYRLFYRALLQKRPIILSWHICLICERFMNLKSQKSTTGSITWDIRWLRLVGLWKLQVSFAKEPCKRDDILQKRPIILRSLLIEATPYNLWKTEGDTPMISVCLWHASFIEFYRSLLQKSPVKEMIFCKWYLYAYDTPHSLNFIGLFCKRAL